MTRSTSTQPSPNHEGRNQLTMSTEWIDPYVVRITARGEVDASNAAQLREYVFRYAANCRNLVLDLRDVTFFSSAGFAALRTINVRCGRANVEWTLQCGSIVSRVVDICDPDGNLPQTID
ncbi:anti-anti-sigma factor [Mycolicibacterium rutilum]|uniref:Anti-anti-sigma factor n=2 Tax=Mycolicibacterium rutilum TaxID=370526 RepID=A0A1H6IHG9_MYCRU|nr:anti-anti-sigma factor [Mycolicibacterium rutilum]